MKYQEALQYIDDLNQYGIVPGLDSIERLCGLLGNPQDKLKFVHIAGTNGKGSTLAYISTVLKCAGYRVGRFISPVIFDFCEMIQVNERPITHKALAEGMKLVKEACDKITSEGFYHPTVFEAETALAFWYFCEMKCDIVVLETGMGGRGDTTNLIRTTLVSVLASISMDHMKFLGKTLSDIAYQKAGIMKQGRPVVSLCQQQDVMEVLQKEAADLQCPIVIADRSKAVRVRYGVKKQRFDYGALKNLEIGLAGKYQIDNAVLAIETLEVLSANGFIIKEASLRKGLAQTNWPGRFSVIGEKPLFVVDGAHNEDAAKKLAESIEFYFTNKRIIYIMGILKDKEYDKIINLTYQYADHIITITPPNNPRGMASYELAVEIAKVHPRVSTADSLEEAVEMSSLLAGKDDVILAFGSLSYLGRLTQIVQKRNQKPAHNGGKGNN